MHFYIDESGHTGANLFDPDQPMLYYGVLSSKLNIDVVARESVITLRKKVDKPRLHAAELGNGGLVSIVDGLAKIQEQMDLRFDVYRVAKPDHAIISFFDQVFDHGINPAITWAGYWTPLRYILLLKLSCIFDDSVAKRAWDARMELNDKKSQAILVEVCKSLMGRVDFLPDKRSQQLIHDTLSWAAANPAEIGYNATTKDSKISVMPNMIGFQSVMLGVASRLQKNGARASRIVVDQQTQFNKSQKTLAEYYAAAKNIELQSPPGMPKLELKGMPSIPIDFMPGTASVGLELVDAYLWIFKRIMEKKDLAPELYKLVQPQFQRGRSDEVSLNAIEKRWGKWFEELKDPSPEQLLKAKDLMAFDEARRQKAIAGKV